MVEYMCLDTLSDDSNPPLNAVQLMVSKVLVFHENTEVHIPYGDSYDLYPGNNEPHQAPSRLSLLGIPVRNQCGWEGV